jgi:hypothetical protein
MRLIFGRGYAEVDSMSIDLKFSDKYGPYVRVTDWEVADELDDFLGENEFVLYNIKSVDSNTGERVATEFYFGKIACEYKIRELLKRFRETK